VQHTAEAGAANTRDAPRQHVATQDIVRHTVAAGSEDEGLGNTAPYPALNVRILGYGIVPPSYSRSF
jgi:hypothetical protein